MTIGGQDCHAEASGAHTGDISAEMLADAGARAVIVGHSERRTDHHETDAQVRAKAQAAWRARLTAIVCVGEQRAEREAGKTLDVVSRQLDGSLPDGATAANLVIAYEPVWAIGTGLTPTPADVAQVHGFVRKRLTERFNAEGGRITYSLWRFGQTRQCQGAFDDCATSMGPWSVEPVLKPRISSVLLRFTDRRGKGGKAASDRVETAANSYMDHGAPPGRRPGPAEV